MGAGMRQFLCVLMISMMIPYVTTLAWTGRIGDGQKNTYKNAYKIETNETAVISEREDLKSARSVEDFLVHVLAVQIPAEFELETLKAQAILSRTYIYGLLDGRTEIYEEELDMDALSTEQMKLRWGEKEYPSILGKLQKAVDETKGLYILYDGTMIDPLYCYAAAGKTRSRGEAYPYLKQVESPWDLDAENYRTLPVFEMRDFAEKISESPGAIKVNHQELTDGGGIQIVERDGAGYVTAVQIGQKTYTGEEVQYALGLNSSCYTFEYRNQKIRVICKGVGHGYGFSQFGANAMAKEGKTYEELLNYYFQNIEIVGAE